MPGVRLMHAVVSRPDAKASILSELADDLVGLKHMASSGLVMPRSRINHVVFGIAAIAVLTLLAYLPAFRAGYVWDDADHVPQAAFQQTGTFLKWVWFKHNTVQRSIAMLLANCCFGWG